jgi:hypothetical protein
MILYDAGGPLVGERMKVAGMHYFT